MIKKDKASQESEVFQTSDGWFDNYEKRIAIHSVLGHIQRTKADKDAVGDFVKEFGEFVKEK